MRGGKRCGKEVAFGVRSSSYKTSHYHTNRQIEAARIAMTLHMKRGGKVWINIFPQIIHCAKAIGVHGIL